MYCYTVLTNTLCALRELDMWTEISKQHPVFIKTVAKSSNIDLPKELINKLDKLNENFEALHKRVKEIIRRQPYGGVDWMAYLPLIQVRSLVETFLQYDIDFLNVLNQVKNYGRENKVWQTLLEHIIHEQEYMYRLFVTLRNQMYTR
ncbi:DUF2935 domain-containing protein [Petroclostridium xylanilyticum]|uniref:DUF2935 domain-containing protein n=1 Tax=Petroclostridium xylanilyticum TaxID=1792311 RepID=UPI0012FF7D2A|nr:DUF2935 domain-containing protein [Petroclostridium xylanilyticum]